MNEGGDTMDLTNDERAALAVLNDTTLTAREAYNAAAAEYERASMAAALVMVRRALAAEAEVERLRAENATLRASTDAAVDGVRAMLPAALRVAREEGAAAMLTRCRTAALDAFMAHPLTVDHRHEPGCICHAIARGSCSECDRGDAIMAALAALPLDAPAEVKP